VGISGMSIVVPPDIYSARLLPGTVSSGFEPGPELTRPRELQSLRPSSIYGYFDYYSDNYDGGSARSRPSTPRHETAP